MRREDYIEELRSRLQGLDEQEIVDAISYCEEYFEEAKDPSKVLEDLGTPAKFAAQIKAESAIKMSKDTKSFKKPKSYMKNSWMVMGGILSLPLTLPIMLTIVILVFTLGVVCLALAFAGIAVIVALFVAAIAAFISSFFSFGSGAVYMVKVGSSLCLFGIASLSLLVLFSGIRVMMPLFMNSITEFYNRHKQSRRGEDNYG